MSGLAHLSPEERRTLSMGAWLLGGLVVATLVVMVLSGRSLHGGFLVYVDFARSGPLHAGCPVRVAGRDIGEVRSLDMAAGSGSMLRATVLVSRPYQRYLYRNSEYFVSRQGVLGDAFLEVGPPPRGAPPGPTIQPGDVLRGVDPPDLDHFLRTADGELKLIAALVREQSPAAHALATAVRTLAADARALPTPDGAPGRIVLSSIAAAEDAGAIREALARRGLTVERVRSTIDRARALAAALAPRIDALSAQVADTRGAAAGMLAFVTPERRAELLQSIARLRASLAAAQTALDGTEALLAYVERGEGTLGAFLADREIHEDMIWLERLLKDEPLNALVKKPVLQEE